jgi:hypothetical protein
MICQEVCSIKLTAKVTLFSHCFVAFLYQLGQKNANFGRFVSFFTNSVFLFVNGFRAEPAIFAIVKTNNLFITL